MNIINYGYQIKAVLIKYLPQRFVISENERKFKTRSHINTFLFF